MTATSNAMTARPNLKEHEKQGNIGSGDNHFAVYKCIKCAS